jgi:hypothetical protein
LLLVICFQWNYPAFGLELEMACCFCPSLGEGNEILLLLELSNWFGTWDSIWPVKQALINTSTFYISLSVIHLQCSFVKIQWQICYWFLFILVVFNFLLAITEIWNYEWLLVVCLGHNVTYPMTIFPVYFIRFGRLKLFHELSICVSCLHNKNLVFFHQVWKSWVLPWAVKLSFLL